MINYYCISLAREIERRTSIENQADAHGISVRMVDAVDGAELDYENIAAYNRAKRRAYLPDMRKNEIACLLSHVKTLEMFLATEAEYAVVLEDDALLQPEFGAVIDTLVSRFNGWDLIRLECRTSKPRGYRIRAITDDHSLYSPLRGNLGTTAILYTRVGARKLLDSLRTFSDAIDAHIGRCWSYGLRLAEVYPPIVEEDKAAVSTIGHTSLSPRQLRVPGVRAYYIYKWMRLSHMVMKRVHAFRCLFVIRMASVRTP